jgi:uncharacterized protein YuzE
MRAVYDPDADALYLRFTEAPIVESDEVADGVILDLDFSNRIVAIEFLNASNRLAEGAV